MSELTEIRKKYELVDLFCNLAEQPSPSTHEEKVINWIQNYCKDNNIPCTLDNYKNVVIRIPATDKSKDSLMLSSHMDVIGDDSPVKPYLEGVNIHAEGRTLGGDDKAGVANILLFAKEVANSNISHGGVEIMFTRDEESGMSGIHHAEFDKFNSKYVLVCDSDTLGQFEIAGASYTLLIISVKAPKGGHSGIDIADKTRKNAGKLIADIISKCPQGLFYEENGQTVTSCNLGGIVAGDFKVTNIINTDAKVSYSIRSSSRSKEEELKNEFRKVVDDFNKENEGIAKAECVFEEHLPPFEKSNDEYLPILFETSAKKIVVTPDITTFHAGAETHIYANKTNAKGEKFIPYLVGLATVCNMHSSREYLDYTTILKGHEVLQEFFKDFNRD
ncbi:MAG: M20/M25/M40 family metallo-hydrolase [Clostridiaceae bacterium]|jgi:acetylornithine deacetylase/succinyl-diaminopimelate desuccinylase-like protein|nr:M20/M25/M40 family metallo-hydrolase [Clostridiaceae bacterium]